MSHNILAAIDISSWSPFTSGGAYDSVDTVISGKVTTLLNFFVGFSAVVAVIMLVVAGYTFITSAGDADKVEKATKMITATIIGLVVVFVAVILVKYIVGVINPVEVPAV